MSRNIGDIYEDKSIQYIITDVKEEVKEDGTTVTVETSEIVI